MSIKPVKQIKTFLCYNNCIVTKKLLRYKLKNNNKTLLIITDGIGHNSSCKYNAFCNANKPTYDYLFENTPNSLIHTHGLSVGLPEGQMGNSEVGHMTIGSGRVLYQDLVKITMAIEDKSIEENNVMNNVVENSNTIHLIGLLSDGGVHSHINHIIGIAQIIEAKGNNVALHLITDGRDVSPTSAPIYIKQIENICNDKIKIASIGGRFYTMDRDTRWERVEAGIVDAANKTDLSAADYIKSSYEQDITDEFIKPVSIKDYKGMDDGDGVIFCNFRSDRAREISKAIADSNFNEFSKNHKNLNIATITQYDKNFPLDVMFPKEAPKNTLGDVISKAGLSQVHTAETEKYAHVTFFFNGGVEDELKGEKRVLIPSPNIATYDMKPEMSAVEVCQAVSNAMNDNEDFIVVNFANGDMVGHTGDFEAGIKAVECVDTQLGILLDNAKQQNYNVIITSDHGNCEKMKDENGDMLTNHTVGDVFCFIIANGVDKINNGSLNNIAPTVLKLMNLPIPEEMDEPLY
jgi:2,3-bisphosphoglycerate-independent phosphoglycerate mutase